MPRIQFSDVTPPERRSIRDIPIPNSGKRKVPINIKQEKIKSSEPESATPYFNPKMPETTENKKNTNAYEYYYPKERKISDRQNGIVRSGKKRWVFGTIAVLLIAAFIVCMMTVFSSATVEITPKSQEVSVNMKINAATESTDGTIKYEVIKLSKIKTVSVPATGEEAVELKASGKIIIYNKFSTDPQRLIVRTRFESPDGLIYRISESIVVPGKTVKDGVETPGSIEATVFADEAGDKYNIKKTDFTIPGFKNDADRYKGFYARSSSDMTGGFVGKQKTVSSADKQTALQSVDTEAQTDLKKDLETKVPEGLVLLSGAISYKSTELPTAQDNSAVTLSKEVTAYAIMIDSKNLSDTITKEYISNEPDWKDIKSVVKDFSALSVSGLPVDFEAGNKITLQINGKTQVWADINTDIIGQRLLGIPKKDAAELMDEFAGISSIKSAVRPIWKQSFPADSFRIHVKTVIQ
jgi:hypothetical protein